MSAKSAVTVLRSPSRFSAAGASATRIGVSPGSLASAAADAPSAAPQSSQNFADGELSAPHFAQRLGSGQPHSLQNFLPEVLSAPHLEQRMSASQPVEQCLEVLLSWRSPGTEQRTVSLAAARPLAPWSPATSR